MVEAEHYIEAPPLEGDIALLRRYARAQEPAAFVELSHRYAGLVFGTCLRITANIHDAEEVTQDCFFELARRAATIHSSVGGWLHSLATHRALNAVRSRKRRREHEQDAVAKTSPANAEEEVAWHQLEPLLDHAIDDLPEELQTPIILHFLEERPQSEVALRLGVHQSTVSRRIQEALEALRARLRESGLVVAVAPLASLLTAHVGQTTGPHFLASLTKIALAGVGSATAAGKTIGGGGASLAKLVTWGKSLGALASPIFVQFLLGGWWGFLLAIAIVAYIAWRRPKWHDELSIAMGGKGYHCEFFPFSALDVDDPTARLAQGNAWVADDERYDGGHCGYSALFVQAGLRICRDVVTLRRSIFADGCQNLDSRASVRGERQRQGTNIHRTGDRWNRHRAVYLLEWRSGPGHRQLLFWPSGRKKPVPSWRRLLCRLAIWLVGDTIGRIRKCLRRQRTDDRTEAPIAPSCESQRPRTTLVVLLVLLVFSLQWTWPALWQCSQLHYLPRDTIKSYEVLRTEGAWAVLPPMALVFLVATIRLLGKLRGKVPRFFWSGLVAGTALLAAVNLTLCAGWLIAQSSLPKVLYSSRPQRDMAVVVSQLQASDPTIRVRAAALLGRLADLKKDKAAIPELRKMIDDQDVELRRRAAIALGLLDASAKDVVPELGKALSDEDQDIRIMAGVALVAMGPAAKAAMPELRKALSENDKAVREMAASALGRIGPAAKNAVPELRKALSDPVDFVRNNAALALNRLGPAAKDAIPELRKAMSDRYWLVRSNAASAIGNIGPAARDAIPNLRKAMTTDENPQVRWVAAGSLGEMGPAAKDAIPDLRKALTDPDSTLRSVAAFALGKIAHKGK